MEARRHDDRTERIVYPESDGQPMADNTLQFQWIVALKENLDALLPGFVAGDLLWYPVEGEPRVRIAPDVLVAPERPKGHRGSYRQWEEAGQPPAVVFEVLSPGNTVREMLSKLGFYGRHGVDELYIVDPELEVVQAFVRGEGVLQELEFVGSLDSPRLGIRFERHDGRLVVRGPDGRSFRTFAELKAERDAAQAERDAAQAERDAARAERDAAQSRAERLAARLKSLGIDLDDPTSEGG